MAYAATGTAGNDTLNQSGDSGPGTIIGLAGDDQISTGSGLATVTGDSGNDVVVLRTGNTGTVNGGTENDCIISNGTAIGPMALFGNAGADTVWVPSATGAQTIVGGNDSSDGNDCLAGGTADDILFGNGGNDTLATPDGNDTYVGGAGNDTINDGLGSDLAFGNEGDDGLFLFSVDTAFGGLGNDSIVTGGSTFLLFGNEGADTITVGADNATVVGGNDSADGNDSILGGFTETGILFGNGGADTFSVGGAAVTLIGGQGGDSFVGGGNTVLIFGNEGNDTVAYGATATVFGGQGNDSLQTSGFNDTIQGNEGNDTIRAALGIDTTAGGSGNDVFVYGTSSDDGDNAGGGGRVERVTDLDWSADRIDTPTQVTFATNTGAGTGVDLNASANNAIAAAFALAGGGAAVVAAQVTFAGRTYLAVDNQNGGAGVLGQFDDANDLLIDITGVTGTIATSNFV